MGEPPQPGRLALDVAEEEVALGVEVLRPRLKDLDRARDRGQRRAQLVRGVRDELALASLAALALGDVDQDEDRGRLRPAGKPLQPERAIVVGANDQVQLLRAGIVQARGELPERRLRPGVDELHPGLRSEQLFRRGVREHDLQVLVDREDALVQPGEQAREAVLVEPAGECGRGGPCHGGSIPLAPGPNLRSGLRAHAGRRLDPVPNRGAADRWQRSRA